MKRPKVSIIIPVWGVENYIDKCAESLFRQTLNDVEYIFVNDCTPDNSIEVLKNVIERYPDKANSIRIIDHHINMGLPAARRTGLQYATGEYIAHCDSDDWVNPETYETIYNYAKQYDVGIVAFDDLESYCSGDFVYHMFDYKDPILLSNDLDVWFMKASLCCKLIHSDLYRKYLLPVKYNHGEDMALFCQIIKYCERILYVPEALYVANKQNESISRVKNMEGELTKFKSLAGNIRTLEEFYGNGNNTNSQNLIKLKFYAMESLLPLFKNYPPVRDIWNTEFPEVHSNILSNKSISFKDKIKYILTRFKLYPFR